MDERWKELPERWDLRYKTPYSEMVGARLKRLRLTRGLTQLKARLLARRPNGTAYSQGMISRLEKGYANSPLYVYLHFADAYEVEPGRLMGSDETQKPITESEWTLLRFLRGAGIAPHEAITRLARGLQR
jgi:transcriptional regulator with XRE-family HTH domain